MEWSGAVEWSGFFGVFFFFFWSQNVCHLRSDD